MPVFLYVPAMPPWQSTQSEESTYLFSETGEGGPGFSRNNQPAIAMAATTITAAASRNFEKRTTFHLSVRRPQGLSRSLIHRISEIASTPETIWSKLNQL